MFVGEALVGNEAVDQLVKFNQALADHSAVQDNPRLIDGIVLTKFDTIDDKVFLTNVYLLFCYLGWCRCFDDLHYWTADRFCRNWSNLHGFENSQCKRRGEHLVEIIYST